MLRRVHVPALQVGDLELPPTEAHHLRAVLRVKVSDEVELFDDQNHTARARIAHVSSERLTVHVSAILDSAPDSARAPILTIASAVPKGDRADWMIEKLSELGAERFVPLQTHRSVVHPDGTSKFQRWNRIATEAAKQSRRAGTMRIDPLTLLPSFLIASEEARVYLCPTATTSLLTMIAPVVGDLTLLIGPEGGWTDQEHQLFASHEVQPARLTGSVLRIETAAITAAAVAQCAISNLKPQD